MRGLVWPLLACFWLVSPVVHAADTGSVSGTVVDASGAPVVDASVTISGDRIPSGRRVQTGTNGTFTFEYLLSGDYTVGVEKTGVGVASRAAIVQVGRDTRLDFVLGLSLSEQVTVTAASPIVDVTSTEVSFNVKADVFSTLPLERQLPRPVCS